MPVIDNFGLVISDQWSVSVHPRGSRLGAIDVFRVSGAPGLAREELLDRAANLVAGLDAVFRKDITSDPFNKLLLRANLQWAQADLVRGYIGYAKQLRLHHPIPRIQEILLKQAGTVRAIIDLFAAKFDPDLPGDRSAAIAQADAAVHDRLRAIRTADEDTVLRFLYNLVEATLRTNFFRSDRVAHYISVKCDHAKIRVMPMPRLMVEVYVHHREMEGVHLRGGPIARGGIRFSDRADFRTEILGLVTTQMVKNVVIVPEGSKGGFYIKYTIDDPAERRRKGDELYQFLMRGLLDVTDNIVEGKVVRPPRVVAHDGDDPYLVVAADKGTAHLSDTANRISLSYGFWLGDAFASGGSNGYDHKVVGITARGGWVLVKRHFREMGMDADKDPFTCIGIGDCGGDVFGNGVIETKVMQLRAAFNHLHIFLDPSPDMERSYAERRRLFDEVKGWEHYDKALLSPGGGVYDRKAKSVTLSPEAVAMLGAPQAEMTPDAVVNLILKMEVDLFWNGGIGTYVRASFETNSNCNDPPNDDVRVSAPELRCKIVGEGGNLGFTQAARIEYALHGGRLNTDFVDNSGGVDTSDHEVNIKILLNPMVRAGRFAEPERNDIIRSLTDEVAEAVLADSNANGRLISLDVIRSQRDPFPYSRAIDWICQKGNVDRHFLVLPTDDDLKRRAAARQGLVRPELAVIQAHVKMHVYKLLLQEDPAIIPGFDQLLQGYFPADLRSRFAADIPGHMLSRAIGMTTLLTEVATDAGAPFFPLMLELTGRSAGTIAGAWMEAMRITGGGDLKAALVAARAKPEGAHIAWTLYTDAITSLVTHWLSPGSRGPGAEDPARFRAALGALAKNRLPAGVAAAAHATEHLVNRGIPAALARGIVDAASGVSASEVCALSDGGDIEATATRYQALGHASGLVPLLAAIATRKAEGRWDPIALGILRLRYTALLRDLYRSGVPADSSVSKSVAALVEGVLGYNADVAALLVGEQRIRAVMA
jgi:glutamate dehydrogenase